MAYQLNRRVGRPLDPRVSFASTLPVLDVTGGRNPDSLRVGTAPKVPARSRFGRRLDPCLRRGDRLASRVAIPAKTLDCPDFG